MLQTAKHIHPHIHACICALTVTEKSKISFDSWKKLFVLLTSEKVLLKRIYPSELALRVLTNTLPFAVFVCVVNKAVPINHP